MKILNDKIISALTVRLANKETGSCIGSGVIYNNDQLKDSVYILTAAHCLFRDGDSFQNPYEEINIDFYNSENDSYYSLTKEIDQKLISKDKDKDVAVIILNKSEIETSTNSIPKIHCIKEGQSLNKYTIKGFPNATQGKELDVIFPTWKQEMTKVHKFQLQLHENYNSWATKGFSGSGVFLQKNDETYLFGIFARFRPEDMGKVIYCQFLDTINEILNKNYLIPLNFTYLGDHGITPSFFKQKVESAIENLGPRFDNKLNFKLPIALKFNEISKNNIFKLSVYKIFDEWLTEKSYRTLNEDENIGYIEKQLLELRQNIKKWLSQVNFSADDYFDTEWIFPEINSFNEMVNEKIDHLYQLRRQKENEVPQKENQYNYRRPYVAEIERLHEITSNNYQFSRALEHDIDYKLVNNPVLIIKGEAGCGKSHLLGDIATDRIKKSIPIILLLGQNFTSSKTISSNILEKLDLQCSFKDFLTTLNSIGKQIDDRVLILIDAINESNTADLWKNDLAGFLKEVSHYPFIGVVLTIRTTYFKAVIPDNIRNKKEISIITHEGFKGNEYAALKFFCMHHGLKQPTFPILAAEFANPLFLQLVCEGAKESRNKAFPLGFQGIKKVFDLYVKAVNKKLLDKNEYSNRSKLVSEAINKTAELCIIKEKRQLKIEEAVQLFDTEFSKFPNLLNDLIRENVFIKNLQYNYDTDENQEKIYFAYERFGDFYIAENLIKDYKTKLAVFSAFENEDHLRSLTESYRNEGILEALSVLLPEKFGIEIYEALEWCIMEEKQKDAYSEKTHSISKHFLKSLNWRSLESIDIEKLNLWISSEDFIVNESDWISKLIELTAIKGHPLNSDRLYKSLKKYSMSDRDSFLQLYFLDYAGHDEYGSSFPVRRLIDWAWTKDISENIDYETARLSAQTLAWILSSTNIILRDRATKAMVNLLEDQPLVLIEIMKSFRRTNDMYILERLYAVAYGCVLRTKKKDGISLIAKYTYNTIFKNASPPKNILLRDYARNICEYAFYLKPSIRFDMSLVRPPYKSAVPIFPTIEDVTKYQIEYNSKTEKIKYRNAFNQIFNSVVSGDFGNKTIKTALYSFYPLEITAQQDLNKFSTSLDRREKGLLKIIKENIELAQYFKEKRDRAFLPEDSETKKEYESKIKFIEDFQVTTINLFEEEHKRWLIKKGINIIEIKTKIAYKNAPFFSANPIKYWIVKKVFNLGYKKNLHGEYDSQTASHNTRHNNQIERIGKKYQWIAFYEILSIITDNFEIKAPFGSKKRTFYKGAWQLYLRNIDPAYTTPNNQENITEDNYGIERNNPNWWDDPSYGHWNIPSAVWAYQLEDLPSAREVLIKKDNNGTEWVHLEHYIEWRQPKSLGEENYISSSKSIEYLIQGYLVKKKDKKKIFDYLSDKSFFGLWMPENRNNSSRLINREKFWSPAYFDGEQEISWQFIEKTNYKVIVATTPAKGSMEKDKSEANLEYNIPCNTLFKGMNLEYASHDGDFIDSSNEIIVRNINPNGILIRKDKLVKYLSENNLEIIWTILGEKISDLGDTQYDFGVPCGVFSLEKDSIKGKMIMHKRD